MAPIRSVSYGIAKIDFDTDSDPDKTISRQTVRQALILRAGDAIAASPPACEKYLGNPTLYNTGRQW